MLGPGVASLTRLSSPQFKRWLLILLMSEECAISQSSELSLCRTDRFVAGGTTNCLVTRRKHATLILRMF